MNERVTEASVKERAGAIFLDDLLELRLVIDAVLCNSDNERTFASMAWAILEAYRDGKTLLIAGNGGSNAEAQHLAGELIAGFENKARRGLRAIALPSSIPVMSAWVNDMGPHDLMVREVETWGENKGVLLLLSSSGESENQVRAARRARELGMTVCSWLGKTGGRLEQLSTHSLVVASMKTSRVQEVHLAFVHMLCRVIDECFAPTQPTA